MNDSKKMSSKLAFMKWKKICNRDMTRCEQDFLRINSLEFLKQSHDFSLNKLNLLFMFSNNKKLNFCKGNR